MGPGALAASRGPGAPCGGPAARAPGPMGPMGPLGMVDDVWMVHRFQQVDLHISIQIYPAISDGSMHVFIEYLSIL